VDRQRSRIAPVRRQGERTFHLIRLRPNHVHRNRLGRIQTLDTDLHPKDPWGLPRHQNRAKRKIRSSSTYAPAGWKAKNWHFVGVGGII